MTANHNRLLECYGDGPYSSMYLDYHNPIPRAAIGVVLSEGREKLPSSLEKKNIRLVKKLFVLLPSNGKLNKSLLTADWWLR